MQAEQPKKVKGFVRTVKEVEVKKPCGKIFKLPPGTTIFAPESVCIQLMMQGKAYPTSLEHES